jgi:hypothetical protein
MRNLKFPEIDKKIQQSVYGAWGGSNSNEPPNGGWFDNGDGITIISNGSGGGDIMDLAIAGIMVIMVPIIMGVTGEILEAAEAVELLMI